MPIVPDNVCGLKHRVEKKVGVGGVKLSLKPANLLYVMFDSVVLLFLFFKLLPI